MTALYLFRSAVTLAAVLALLLTHVAAAPPSNAQAAGSIVFVVEHNVWIMAGDDPTSARPVTTDGTEANPYSAPSQDDAGRIMAVRGPVTGSEEQTLVLMDQNGTPLQAPFRPSSYGGIQGMLSLDMLPTGEAVALSLVSTQCAGGTSCGGSDLQATDGSGSLAPGVFIDIGASWTGPTQVVAGNTRYSMYDVGDAEQQPWFDACDFDDGFAECRTGSDPEVTRDGDLLVSDGGGGGGDPAELHIYAMNGAPPAEPTFTCTVTQDGGSFRDPAWSPDGTSMVVSYGPGVFGEAPSMTPGIYRLSGFGTGDCAQIAASLTLLIEIDDPDQADWSAAPLGTALGQPPPPPTDPGSGPSTPPMPDEALLELPDGARMDGGGSVDPVGQAVETSRQIWADGGAALVVLATADRFPDALAGAALAGELGPILVTPFASSLDPRVEEEIARATGGTGQVLILGGTAAVSESAATQARAAAGSQTCPQPFPADCRYAGGGREETAALIGETVLALHDGSGGRALLARGDVFADAITGGAYAAEAGVPILLTPSDHLNATTREFVEDNDISEVIILGGTAAVAQPTVDAVPAVTRRIAGDERTATAAAIATQLWDAEGLGGGGIVLVNVRHDDGWQTALSAAVVSALANAPQLGVENPPQAPSPATEQAAAQVGDPVAVFGSTTLVSNEQLQAVQTAGS